VVKLTKSASHTIILSTKLGTIVDLTSNPHSNSQNKDLVLQLQKVFTLFLSYRFTFQKKKDVVAWDLTWKGTNFEARDCFWIYERRDSYHLYWILENVTTKTSNKIVIRMIPSITTFCRKWVFRNANAYLVFSCWIVNLWICFRLYWGVKIHLFYTAWVALTNDGSVLLKIVRK